ncbi:dTDP-4-dehydrorhamnose reductase [Microvirga vignae]|uniref:dTDP-4-dehydrorhamnose reductase n=1 Tax=Microvirga vignae TaxID=1225564 RepID=A0A0H1R4F7_9HYPH|nr:dTDP-4-dehydrorhamnose reductase [Microvirga vignae]KLK89924.1 dTDP-4-dehydrorhamnose reductase [Microvirga vignae]
MRIVVTGTEGQVVRALLERGAAAGVSVIAVGRPHLDLLHPGTVSGAIQAAAPDIIVNAAAYTAVDQAESGPELAMAINGQGAAAVAAVAAALNVPVVHLSTDYVFDGLLDRPYRETDPVGPVSAYGRSKLLGEQAVRAATRNHVILRTAWVYSPFGKNFVKTMLRLAETRGELAIVSDQRGSPTSAHDIADGIVVVCRNLLERPTSDRLRGIFHMAGAGDTTWADFAARILEQARSRGGPFARVRPISTAEYPTPAQRPANSRLDCTKLFEAHGVKLPDWQISLTTCVARLVEHHSIEGIAK